MTSLSAAASGSGGSVNGLMEWVITSSLTVHCFSRDGKLAGHGPLFILREWDMKVIRTIGHKPRCKGLNTEQALRACVRQGLLSLQLRTENASKDEIQLLKSVNVLGKRAPSGSLIGAADLMRLLEYFSKRDVAEAFRGVVKRKHDEGVVSDDVWREVASVKEREILHKFKINTDDVDDSANDAHDSRDDDDGDDRADKRRRSKGSSSNRAASGSSSSKGKRSSAGGSDSRRSKKRKSGDGSGDGDEGRGGGGRSKRRRSSVSSTSMHSSSSGSSLSSLDSHNESRRRRHRNGHRRHRSDRSVSPARGDRRDKRSVDYHGEYVAMPAGGVEQAHYNGQYEVVNGGGGRVTYAPVVRGSGQQAVVGVSQNGKAVPVLQVGRGRADARYYSGAPPQVGGAYTVAAPHVGGGSPPSYTNGLYTATGRSASYTLSALPPHIQQSLQQYSPSLSSSLHPLTPSGQPPSVLDPNLPPSDHGLDVLMQVISDNKGGRTTSKHVPIDPSAIGQHPLVPVRGQLVNAYEQPPAQLSSTEQLYLQQQRMQQVYLSGQSQLSPPSIAYRPSLLPNGVKHKDSPTYISSASSFSFNSQPAPLSTAVLKKEYGHHSNAVNGSSSSSPGTVPSPVRMPAGLPSVPSSTSLSSSILSPNTPESSTPTSSSVHRPQPRLSPANSFNNLPALASSSGSVPHPPITRTLSSNSLSLGLPNSSSVSSLSSLLNGGGSLSYNALHTSMSMTSLNAADVSDGDDDDGDAGINGILHFDDDIEGGADGRNAANYYPAYTGGTGSPLPRVSSIQSLAAAGGHSPMPRIPSNLSTLTSSFLPSPPPSRPASPARTARIEPPAAATNGATVAAVAAGGTETVSGSDGGGSHAGSGSEMKTESVSSDGST